MSNDSSSTSTAVRAELQSAVVHSFDYLRSINADYIDELYTKYIENPDSVDPSWKGFFDGLYLGEVTGHLAGQQSGSSANWTGELKVYSLIQAYREHGHLLANTNPLYAPPKSVPELALSRFGLSDQDLGSTFQTAGTLGMEPVTLRQIIAQLQKIYCGTVGIETLQMQTPTERMWVEERIEALRGDYNVSADNKKFILERITASESLERFIHTRYVAQKRFSIEGGEALIPALDCITEVAALAGAEEVVMGMAHRGRLNVMVNTFGKKPEFLFTEFDDNYRLSTDHGEGDVKYHKGYSRDLVTRQGKNVHLSLGFNPSHLEYIGPVVVGMTRAKQAQRKDGNRAKVVAVLMHGDAAFTGQGIVYETIQASRLDGYNVGGTIHLISNNQVGFTTDPDDARSTRYCTDLARAFDCPIFHVNGDDPEALWHVAKIATEFRYQFGRDVFIDIICYRRYGHNEGDEPSFTQPALYKLVAAHANPREVYTQRLVGEGLVTADEAKSILDRAIAPLSAALEKVRAEKPEPFHSEYQGTYWSKYHPAHTEDIFKPVNTRVSANTLVELTKKINRFPADFKIHPKLERMFDARINTVETGKGIDWGNAEVLAYATLINEGTSVRLSGQDVKRGTFTHRHAAVFDFNDNREYVAINHLGSKAALHVFNSHLSETGAMGVEFGWSVSDPDSLAVWEAQFGDFANGAQVIIDQFLATSESKWHRASGLTLLLPHGFEGQGPEHSSARIERFLQLCGKYNMYVCNPTTPAQIFHLLRRQVKRLFRKPLVVMTPKSLLRHPQAVSDLTDLSNGAFQEVIDDPFMKNPTDVKRVMICSGKIYYDLVAEREKQKKTNIAVIRLEQMYPFPETALGNAIERYTNAKEVFYVQEEPRNMGSWMHFQGMWSGALASFGARFPKLSLTYVGREVCASPAVGSKKLHDKEQQEILLRAIGD
ncbi:MAG: 2-oxoglutarate dehydrogenase E1 component [Bdellovibrionales bacterium]|nr:2-oxoglutarate dehydrogenase E1 component [Bdellovibrionales bacterium]